MSHHKVSIGTKFQFQNRGTKKRLKKTFLDHSLRAFLIPNLIIFGGVTMKFLQDYEPNVFCYAPTAPPPPHPSPTHQPLKQGEAASSPTKPAFETQLDADEWLWNRICGPGRESHVVRLPRPVDAPRDWIFGRPPNPFAQRVSSPWNVHSAR